MAQNRKIQSPLVMRVIAMTLFMAVFAQFAQAQSVKLKMTNGTENVPDNGFLFYDSGGDLLFTPGTPEADEYNWTTWYQHNEEYTLTLVNPEGGGVRIEFEKILVNNDLLSFYEASDNSLIGTFSNNDYSTTFCSSSNKLIVESHGNMTVCFESDYHWRDEGWEAKVYRTTSFTPRPPVAMVAACDNQMSLIPTSKGTISTKMQYSLDGGSTWTDYTEGALVDINSQTFPLDVKVRTIIDEGESTEATSAEKTFTFSQKIQNPAVPTYTPEYSSNKITTFFPAKPDGVNDTYYIRWTINNNPTTANENPLLWDASGHEFQQPNNTPNTVPAGDIDYTNVTLSTPFYIHFATRGTTCPDRFSNVVTVEITARYAPMPTISFETNSSTQEGATTLACSLNGASIYYTTDGSDPTSSSTLYSGNFNVAAGTTVKAIAVKEGYTTSAVASAIYVPGAESGEPQSGTYGGIVLLDDREDHSWSYYSDGDQPIHSLNPADVKITYFGNGKMYTSTGATPSGNLTDVTTVQVSPTENENTFIYLKTLERANGDAGTGSLAYTLIPNPFSVRPKFTSVGTTYYTGFYGWRVKSLNGIGISGYNVGDIIPAETEIQFVTDNSEGNEVEFEAVWARAYVTTSTSTSGLNANVSYERNFMVLSNSPGSTSTNNDTQWPTSSSNTTTDGRYLPIYQYSNRYPYSLTQQIYTPAQVGGAGVITGIAFYVGTTQSSNRSIVIYAHTTTENTIPNNGSNYITFALSGGQVYSGTQNFNTAGWHTITLDNPINYDGTSNLLITVLDNTGSTKSSVFRTYSSGGRRAVYYSASSAVSVASNHTADGTSTYNNQIQFLRPATTNSNISGLTVPLTITTHNPDGTGGSSSVTISGEIVCGADLKFENIKLNAIPAIDAHGNDLVFGRGITPATTDGLCASNVYGYYDPAASTVVNSRIRIESGSFNNVQGASNDGNTFDVTSTGNSLKFVFGNDYDRAKNMNSELSVRDFLLAYSIEFANGNHLDEVTVKSGTFTQRFYNGYYHTGDEARGSRNVLVEGGLFNCDFAGGINGGDPTVENILIRIKGGTFEGAIYGSGEYASAQGDRRLVITGGNIAGWIAGGCNGLTTSDATSGGELYGDTYLYIGGKTTVNSGGNSTVIGNSTSLGGNVYGAGSGKSEAPAMGQVNNSTVVIADHASIERNVFGGGNYGYVNYDSGTSDIYILGGSIVGSVFGGSNLRNGYIVNMNMKNGTVEGNLYGGSNEQGFIFGLATINVSGGTVTNVFGGGYGENTKMWVGTAVNISGGTISNNVYGGGEEGSVRSNTHVSISGGTMKDVFGAGKGDTGVDANINGNTYVNVSGGTMNNVFGGGENGTVKPTEEESLPTTYGFETGLGDWTTIDADGDGYNWQLTQNGHAGYGMTSASFINNVGPLTPNNYLISPQIPLEGTVTFWACAQDANYPDEHFGLAVSTTNNTSASAFTTIQEWTLTAKNGGFRSDGPRGSRAQGTWHQFTVDLSSYNGQMGYVAIRHFNCTDKYMLIVDDISFTHPNLPAPTDLMSSVTLQGGTVQGDVFGGGKLGKTTGDVVVNVFGGSVEGNVYGGAFGKRNEVYIAGTHTVNVTGGNINQNVYGGSRNADDALTFDHTGYELSEAINHVNISGGHIYYQVFASGYFGETYGSVYAFIGANAINNAPNAAPTSSVSYNAAALIIDGSVWAGADYGNFDGEEFGASTIKGHSNVYIDGTGYNTTSTTTSDAGYMNIGGSVLGTGTSCHAGEMGSILILRNYGQPVDNPDYSKTAIIEPYTSATRNLMSLQFFNTIDIDNAHLHLIGQGRINSLNSTEEYSVYGVGTPAKQVEGNLVISPDILRMVNGSSLFIDFPMDQVMRIGSYTCSDVYAASPSYAIVGYSDLGPNNGKDNKFRVNNGAYLNVKYLNGYGDHKDYGELIGFFYMMTDDENNTCAYARPKQSTDQGNQIPTDYDNQYDGGFLSYDATNNTYNAAGGTANPGVQMPYENHTLTSSKNGEQYFRIWRYGGIFSYREGVFSAVAKSTAGYSTADVVISMPAQHGIGSYFRIKTENGFPLIDYGTDVMTVNAGVYNSTNGTPASDGWMYYDKTSTPGEFVDEQEEGDVSSALAFLDENPNMNFGLVAIPQGSLVGTYNGNSNDNWLICNDASDAGEALTTDRWYNTDNVTNPSVLFRLTYNNLLTNNATWDPIIIIFEQCDADGNVVDEIKVALSVNTITTINQAFSTQTYAMMNGSGTQADMYTAKVVLPGFTPYVNTVGDFSNWTFVSASFTPAEGFTSAAWTSGSNYVHTPAVNNEFSMQIVPSANFDNTVGWSSYDHTTRDLYTLNESGTGTHLGYTDGRNPTAFDFILHYDGRAECTEAKKKMGDLVVTLHFTNIDNGTETHDQDLTITVEVFRRGTGNNYYLDGVNGDNFFAGDAPDAAKQTLSGIFYRTEYTPGDNIFIVNTVTANGANALDWNGEEYGKVTLYRYPGGHALKKDEAGTSAGTDYYAGYSTDYNPDNKGFAGTLVKVERGMNMHGIVLDGAYDIAIGHPNAALAPNPETNYQVPTNPMIDIATNGVLTVYADSKLQWNYTNSNGGAVYNAGKMIIRDGSDINHNAVLGENLKGAGVYVKEGATLIVSDSITIDGNYRRFNSGSKAIVEKNSNVYLEGENSVIQVGTSLQNDGILALENHLNDDPNPNTGFIPKSAKIGVTKGAWPDTYYNPIAYSDGGGSAYLGNLIPADPDNTLAKDYIIYDDDEYYKVVTLNNTTPYEPSSDYLFWVGTWVTAVRTEPAGFAVNNIDSPEDLAWAISYVNGLNDSPAHFNANLNVTADIDMSANIWVPMGIEGSPYTGTFNGNGHTINGVKSSLNGNDMGMFANLNGTVKDMVLNVSFTGGTSIHMGSVAAHMDGGTISNVEAAGTITGTSSTETIGGIVAEKTAGTIHSSFAVNTMTATNTATHIGGLVGNNAGDLLNSYANATMSGSDHIGGLVGKNNGRVENCYAVVGSQTFPAFADENAEGGTIQYCYADNANGYVTTTATGTPTPVLQGHGTYADTYATHTYQYLYGDNAVSLETAGSNSYVATTISYNTDGTQIDKWPGLLSTLNQWVKAQGSTYTKWLRPTTKNINDDLPVLCFPNDSLLATTDGKFLDYTADMDAHLTKFNSQSETAHLFLYKNAVDVAEVPEDNVNVYINEDVVLKQAASAGEFINTQVGVSFDNSFGNASDFFGNTLAYDWHTFSTPLADASLGISYTDDENVNPWASDDPYHAGVQAVDVNGSYMPDGNGNVGNWDLYSFYEPEYQWINLKRNSSCHYHFDDPHAQINYNNESIFTPGKGYMAAINKDTYLCNSGTLNGPSNSVSITLTKKSHAPGTEELGYNLIGNPYQAYLDVNGFLGQNSLSSYWVYVAEENNYIAGNADASTNPALPSATLHPHQGFFVLANSDGQKVSFDYSSMALTEPVAHSYFRGEKLDYPLVNLFVTDENHNKDLAVIEFNRPEVGGSKKMRAINNATFELSSHYNGQNYSILFTESGEKRIPVHFTTKAEGAFTMTWATYHGQFTSLFLVDNITGVHTDMLRNDHYTFNGTPDDYASRFYITFKCTEVDEQTVGGEEFAWFDGNDWVVTGEGYLQLVDVTGRVLQSRQLAGETSFVNFGKVSAGVYMLRLSDGQTAKVQKIVVR